MSRRVALPIDPLLPEVVAALRQHPAVVLRAETGAGKTTRVPSAILDARPAGARVLLLEPRRLAARLAAARMAEERDAPLGGEVGYQVRFEQRSSRATRLLVVTEGVLLRFLQDDPFLERFDTVIFDEFHERNLDSDVALAMVRRVQEQARPELKIVVMSATLDPAPVARFLGGVPVFESAGRRFPLTIEYASAIDDRPLPEQVAAGVLQALDSTPAGVAERADLLAFLPGVGEIRRTRALLERAAAQRDVDVRELYGDLAPGAQDAALRPGPRRRVVLSTNIAETSITVEGVTIVVDSGRARVPRFDPQLGFDRLDLGWISRAAADQRAGRAGRLAPGRVLRLWTARQHEELAAEERPEIQRADLARAVLELRAWGEHDLAAFPWFEAPAPGSIERALNLLEDLGALAGGRVTPVGRALTRLPLPPRLARLALSAARAGAAERGALLAALLAERTDAARGEAGGPRSASGSDLLDLLERAERDLARGETPFVVRRARDQILRGVRDETDGAADECAPATAHGRDESILRAVFAAYPDRLARRREPGSARALLVGGKGVQLAAASAVTHHDLFVCVDVRPVARGEAIVYAASGVEPEWISESELESGVHLRFDARRERVEAIHQVRYRDLVLREASTSTQDAAGVAALLAREAANALARVLPTADDSVASHLARVRCLAEWRPELGLPTWTPEELAALLPALCAGRRSFDEVRRAPWLEFLLGALRHDQRQALDRDAPERLRVPSGSQVRIQYEPGQAPVLAVRIQELFGLATTPRLAGGRVPVLLHLLAPNGRPQQVTHDLESFWRNTYPQVRKELRARYPRHAWPEDPTQAAPERRPRRKKD
ncbi:MAG: ATP-dependent helicase HrpB [Planctomycetota bacterium]